MPNVAPLGPGDPLRLGPFVLSGRVGEGGQGVVYLGHGESGEPVAVKLLHIKFSGDAMARSRFGRELRAAERVASFCTARVIAADLEGDTPYIASEYIDGRSLREVVEENGPISGPALERLAVGTATALTAIHHAGIVHRDFKPDNVLLAPDGPRVVDFGIARIIDSTGTITSRAIGTPAYMSPEQISGDMVGPPSDVFAWASTIAYAATGAVAFGGDSIAVVLNRVLNHDIDVSMLPEPLRGVVRSCLNKLPAARPTADSILLRLLGRPESGDASTVVLSEGATAAAPEPGEITREMRVPQVAATGESPGSAPRSRASRSGESRLPEHESRISREHAPDEPALQAWEAGPGDGPAGGTRGRDVAESHAPDLPPGRELAQDIYVRDVHTWSTETWATHRTGSQDPGRHDAGRQDVGNNGETHPAGAGRRRRRGRLIVAVLAAAAALVAGGTLTAVYLRGDSGLPDPTPTGGGGARGSSAAGTSSSVVDKALQTGKLTIGVKGDLPGVGLGGSDGSFAGFDVDVAKYIATELGVRAGGVTFKRIGRAERAKVLTGQDVDLVVATYAYDDNRADPVGFAGPYYVAHTDVLVPKGSPIRRIEDLAGKRVCAPSGSQSVALIQDRVDVEPVAVDNYATCMDKLVTGQVDAVPGDDLILAGFANRVRGLRLAVAGLKLTDQRYVVGMPKGDARTCEAVQAAISRMYADGTLKKLLERHFGDVDFDAEDKLPAPLTCGS
ncbi:bifunctional serine/threonine-protein kinase/glutamate ABC transporter substrate-binding protein [Microtetraspora malaysiensis]|uniref:bifunctional serine/threonine-protein kinase/glutamate ABC transporter substrate-binding protein n=1 Tax=Microtetraspora malaysiensis TaxID=161358 RepID=UPI003D8DC1EE